MSAVKLNKDFKLFKKDQVYEVVKETRYWIFLFCKSMGNARPVPKKYCEVVEQ